MTSTSSRPKRILLFTPHVSVGGGVLNFNMTLKDNLSSRFNVEPFTIGRRPGLFGKVLRPLVPFFDAVRLVLVLLRRHHDVYHVNPSLVPHSIYRDGLFLLILRAFRRKNILVFIHGWSEEYYRRIAGNRTARSLFHYAFSHASTILVLANSFANDLIALEIPADKVKVITTMFDGKSLRQLSRSRRAGTPIQILFLARFIAAKGVYELLDAFKKICNSQFDALLIMAGDGVEGHRMRDWCRFHGLENRVRFPGYVDGREKAQLLLDADIFILPSYHGEGCPVALLEAMGAGLPVIVSGRGGVPDIVENGLNGIILPAIDSDSIAAALRSLISNSERRELMGSTNRQQAWRQYEARAVSIKIEHVYEVTSAA